ncbi:MAG: MobF family relaxase [Jatrophihabitans sp.]|uniref:MobF family relaxase n=1 Tax=Jatrophihabitans sp. TaxID=1932789 RepID=UPI003F7DAEFF
MSLHKLTAGDGYTYLTRQVAVHDSTERGLTGLSDYYSARGESPGRWIGAGLASLDGVELGDVVTAEQMKALFGEGRHPNAVEIERAVAAAGQHPNKAVLASRLGVPYRVFDRQSAFRIAVAEQFTAHNLERGQRWNTPIPPEVRAGIRTAVATSLFSEQFGRPPLDSRELAGFVARESRQATTAVAGFDLTFSPVKSVSALWAVAPRAVAEQIEAAHHAAVADTIRYLESCAAFTREGRDGARQVDVTGLAATAFTHRDSRAGDPDLHTHVAVSNKVCTTTGKWLALDGRVLYRAKVPASEHYNTRIETELRARLGIRFAPRGGVEHGKRPVREIVGVDPRLLARWSTRRSAIVTRQAELATQFQRDHGRPPTEVEAIDLAQQATLSTRAPKHEPRTVTEQRAAWTTEADGVLGRGGVARMLRTVLARTDTTDAPRATAEWVHDAAAQAVTTVAATRATWTVWHLRAEAQRRVRAAGIPLGGIDEAVDAIVTAALDPAVSVPLGTTDALEEPALLRRRDGTSVYTVAGSQLYTSRAVLADEALLLSAARRSDGVWLDDGQVDQALCYFTATSGVRLNDGQAHLVRRLATSSARLQVAIAPAGAGKTTALAALADVWARDGGTIIGLAPSAAAAAALRRQIGTRTDTLAKLLHDLETAGIRRRSGGLRIDARTLVIVDEAGMAGTHDLARLVEHALNRGASVRLVGDDHQLAAVAAGGVLRDIAEQCGTVTLTDLMRFDDPAEGAATLALRVGDPAAIGFYLDHGRVHVGDLTTATDSAYQAWRADRAAGHDAVMLAPTRALVTELNVRARADRIATYPHPGVGREPVGEVPLADGTRASAGDVIIARRNDRRLPITTVDRVKNGDRFTITTITADGALEARHHGTNRSVTLPAAYVAADVELGYATTVHTAQGVTADTCHLVATGAEDRQMLYVALTRGRTANHIHLAVTGDGDPHNVIKPEALLPATCTDLLTGILARDGAQRSATSSIADLAGPAARLHAAATRYHDALSVAAEHVLGKQQLTALDHTADARVPGLTNAPAWPTLRAHLALLAADLHDPVAILSTAIEARELGTAADPAAVLNARLHSTYPQRDAGPLPWLPPTPALLRVNNYWSAYLAERTRLVQRCAAETVAHAAGFTPRTAPPWAQPLLPQPRLLADVAVWRAAENIPDSDRRPTGELQVATTGARYQHDLAARADTLTNAGSTGPWVTACDRLDPRIRHDDYWPVLADHLARLHRAGINTTTLIQRLGDQRPLPDDMPAAALWWRISRHVAPAALTTDPNADQPRPAWAGHLADAIGPDQADAVQRDPAWPALLAAVDRAVDAGWTADNALHTATELAHLRDHHLHPATDTPSSDVAAALTWRITLLLTAPHTARPLAVNIEGHPAAVDQPPYDPDYDTAPPDHDPDDPAHVSSAPASDWPDTTTERSSHLRAALADVLAPSPLTAPDDEPLWAALDDEHKWATAPVSRSRLLELNRLAAAYFASHYPDSWASTVMRDRLGTDLHNDALVSPGYAPAGFTNLVDHLRGLGATDTELLAAGLAKRASTGRLIDVFRDRLVLPIHGQDDTNPGYGGIYSGIYGFVARRHPDLADDAPYAGPKYLNTRDTDLFTKGDHLFGLAGNSQTRRRGGVPVVVEGPFDALAVTLAGGGRFIGLATLGTALTTSHGRQLRALHATEIVIAGDADDAGRRATRRAYWKLTDAGINPHHAQLPNGHDPAQLLHDHGPAALQGALTAARPLAYDLIDDAASRRGPDIADSVVAPKAADYDAIARVILAGPPSCWTATARYADQHVPEPARLHQAVIARLEHPDDLDGNNTYLDRDVNAPPKRPKTRSSEQPPPTRRNPHTRTRSNPDRRERYPKERATPIVTTGRRRRTQPGRAPTYPPPPR